VVPSAERQCALGSKNYDIKKPAFFERKFGVSVCLEEARLFEFSV
jgi:hypothetical protein